MEKNVNACKYCSNTFKSNRNLKIHQGKAKYCLKIQGKLRKNTHNCEYCNKKYTSNQNLIHHINNCNEKKLKDIEIKYEKKLKEKDITIEKMEVQIQDLQNKLEHIAIEATKRPVTINNTSTNNNQRINQIINNLQPITDEHLRDQAQYLTIEHIKNGAEGYAQYALEYPLKDRVVCVDFSRRKLKYKDEVDNLITDPEMNKLSQKLFTAIDNRNDKLIQEYTEKLKNKLYGDDEKDDLTETETSLLNVQTDAIIDDITKMVTQRRDLKDVAQGLKPEMYHSFVRNVCSNSV